MEGLIEVNPPPHPTWECGRQRAKDSKLRKGRGNKAWSGAWTSLLDAWRVGIKKAAKGVLEAKTSRSNLAHHCLKEKVCNEFQKAGLPQRVAWGGESSPPSTRRLASEGPWQVEDPEHRNPFDELQLDLEPPGSRRSRSAWASSESEDDVWVLVDRPPLLTLLPSLLLQQPLIVEGLSGPSLWCTGGML